MWLARVPAAVIGAANTPSGSLGGWSDASRSPLAGLGQLALSLIVIVALIFAMAWLYKRARGIAPNASSPLRVVAQLALGHKERLVLVEVDGKQLLLGVAPGRVNTLHELDEPVTPPAGREAGKRFGDIFDAIRSRRSGS